MKQIQKLDFMAIVGFFSHTALVDKKLRNKIKNLDITSLLKEGYYKEAIRLAFYENNDAYKEEIVNYFKDSIPNKDFSYLMRKFGIQETIISSIKKVRTV